EALPSAVIGSIVHSVPPSCVTPVINGRAYQQCGNTWYEPRSRGTTGQCGVITRRRGPCRVRPPGGFLAGLRSCADDL
ncbi:hypothetical protein, partial [Stenotrophomonas sp. SrG]|uniref:hypothetical protein n=1 Tax=Stenotrophomonas sp. SrG TaxID=3414430 RepID=UPI003CEB4BF0